MISITEALASILISWIPDPKFAAQWGALVFQWPLTVEQLMSRQEQHDVTSLCLMNLDEPIGFIEIVEESPQECRLCRIIISPQYRGQGLGVNLLKRSLIYISSHYPSMQKVSLAVFEHNNSARHCYESVGFSYTDKISSRQVGDEDWTLLHMTKAIEDARNV